MPKLVTDRNVEALLLLFAFVVLAASLTLPSVNPWPQDNWFSSQYLLFGQFHGTDNYVPVAAPAVVYWFCGIIASLFGKGIDLQFYVISVIQNCFVFLAFFFTYLACKNFVGTLSAAIINLAAWFFFLSTGTPQACWSENVTVLLISLATYLTIRCTATDTLTNQQLCYWAILVGLIVGLAAATRVIPIFLAPALAVIFITRHSFKKGIVFLGLSSAISAACVAGVISANGYRFDKLSLSDSTGRHLWNGVMTFSIAALDGNSQFEKLRQSNPQIEKSQWWQLSFPDAPTIDSYNAHEYDTQWGAYNRYIEDYLKPLALQAIKERPDLFIFSGLRKFYENIKRHPMRYGFSKGSYNPLVTSDFLPPLATFIDHPVFEILVGHYNAITSRFHYGFGLIYPITIFILFTTLFHTLLSELLRRSKLINTHRRRANAVYIVSSTLLSLLLIEALTSGFGKLRTAFISILCMVVFLLQVYYATRPGTSGSNLDNNQPAQSTTSERFPSAVLFMVFCFLFSGSIFISWLIEVANPRAVLPYFPLYALLLCLSIRYWTPGRHLIQSNLSHS